MLLKFFEKFIIINFMSDIPKESHPLDASIQSLQELLNTTDQELKTVEENLELAEGSGSIEEYLASLQTPKKDK